MKQIIELKDLKYKVIERTMRRYGLNSYGVEGKSSIDIYLYDSKYNDFSHSNVDWYIKITWSAISKDLTFDMHVEDWCMDIMKPMEALNNLYLNYTLAYKLVDSNYNSYRINSWFDIKERE